PGRLGFFVCAESPQAPATIVVLPSGASLQAPRHRKFMRCVGLGASAPILPETDFRELNNKEVFPKVFSPCACGGQGRVEWAGMNNKKLQTCTRKSLAALD